MKAEGTPHAGERVNVARTAWSSKSLSILVCGAMCAVLLYFARVTFIPVALALLLALALSSPVEALHVRGLARGVRAIRILTIDVRLERLDGVAHHVAEIDSFARVAVRCANENVIIPRDGKTWQRAD